MEPTSQIRNILGREFRRHRQDIRRQLNFDIDRDENNTLSRVLGVGTRENPIVVEDSDEESTFGTTEREQNASYKLLRERVRELIGATAISPQASLLFIDLIIGRVQDLEGKIGTLQGVIDGIINGETDSEAEDTDQDEIND